MTTTNRTYIVSTVTETAGQIATAEVDRYADKAKAMNAAKRAAHTRKDCIPYGPSSLAYVGADTTAVVSW